MKERLLFDWETDVIPGAEETLQKAAEACARLEGLTMPVYAQILVTTDERIHEINREYRQVDRATDVLSFPSTHCHPGETLGKTPRKILRERDDTGSCFLGDIVISLERAREQAQEYGHSLRREMTYLTVHALFHLMGYDHMKDEDKKMMRAMEEKALSGIGVSRVTDEELMQMAVQAMEFSYSPYSHFRVGAALMAKDGKVFSGCNIENASYGVAICAERTALFKAVSEGEREFTAIAIAAEKGAPWPCGACRQALNEFAPDLRVIVTWQGNKEEALLSDLLPHAFGPGQGTNEFLGKE